MLLFNEITNVVRDNRLINLQRNVCFTLLVDFDYVFEKPVYELKVSEIYHQLVVILGDCTDHLILCLCLKNKPIPSIPVANGKNIFDNRDRNEDKFSLYQ